MSDNGAIYHTVLDEHAQQRVDVVYEQLRASNERLARLEEDNLRLRGQSANLTSHGQRSSSRQDLISPIRPVRLFRSGTEHPTTEERPAFSDDQHNDGLDRNGSGFERGHAYIDSVIEKKLNAFESMIERMPGVAPSIRRPRSRGAPSGHM
ncbi:unnamed protein product [Cochlearia groenlandica]